MSIEYCIRHSRRYDSDYILTCYNCDQEELEMHPKAAELLALKEASDEAERIKRANLDLWVKQLGLRFVHVRKLNYEAPHLVYNEYEGEFETVFDPGTKGGITVAYNLPKPNYKRIIPVSISIVHDNDVFCKRTGRYIAAKNFYNGHTIDVRVPKDSTPARFLKEFFLGML